ncbi:MAG: 50S ribosomal protein L24 [Planctomycetota bacterium]
MRFKKGDQVEVIAGNDKTRRGEILEVDRKRGRVVVDGINLRWKHKKPTQDNPKGERVQQACSVHASNVMLVDPATGNRTRKRPSEK